jgi:hypothetical protein
VGVDITSEWTMCSRFLLFLYVCVCEREPFGVTCEGDVNIPLFCVDFVIFIYLFFFFFGFALGVISRVYLLKHFV